MLIFKSDTVSPNEGILKPVKTQTLQLNQGNGEKYKQIKCLTLQWRHVNINTTVLLIFLKYTIGNTMRTSFTLWTQQWHSLYFWTEPWDSSLQLLNSVNVHISTFLDIFFMAGSTSQIFCKIYIYKNNKKH